MRAGVPYVLRFTSKFFLEILPAALASVIGGFLFAQYQASAPAQKPVVQAVSSLPADRLAAMVEEEHAMLLDYLKRDHGNEKANAAGAAGVASAGAAAKARPAGREAKDSVVRLRRVASADERTGGISPPQAARLAAPAIPMPPPAPSAAAPTTVAAAAPTATAAPAAPEVSAIGPLASPAAAAPTRANDPFAIGERDRAALADLAPRAGETTGSEGVIGSVLSKASAIKDKAINATGDAVTFVVHDIPSRVLPGRDKADEPAEAQGADTAQGPAQHLNETTW